MPSWPSAALSVDLICALQKASCIGYVCVCVCVRACEVLSRPGFRRAVQKWDWPIKVQCASQHHAFHSLHSLALASVLTSTTRPDVSSAQRIHVLLARRSTAQNLSSGPEIKTVSKRMLVLAGDDLRTQ